MIGLSEHLHAVNMLVKKMGMSLEEAFRTAEVPPHQVEEIKKILAEPTVTFTPPDIIEIGAAERGLPYCVDLGTGPQPYIAALRNYLLNERKRQPRVVEAILQNSEELVKRLPKPDGSSNFQCRGLVVGHIQSGKTANMAGLIARAADQGYRLFVILAGIGDDLRAQTQRRMDQEITGDSDNRENDGPFVSHDPTALRWVRLTNSGLEGEFKRGTNPDYSTHTLKLAVIKKHPSVIRKFTQYLKEAPVSLGDQPALIIDDEADQASIDTNYGLTDEDGTPLDPTSTNKRIRDLLLALPKCSYVGFTATPFANVLIDKDEEQDLYPRDFIFSLPEPEGYLGPRFLFGLGMDSSDISPEQVESPRLDVIRHIPPEQVDLITHPAGAPPNVITEGILAFVLSSCGRLARGQTRDHFSMLIHTTGRTGEQNDCYEAVNEEFIRIKEMVLKPKYFPNLLPMVKNLWEQDFERVSRTDPEANGKVSNFETIWKFAGSIVESIQVIVLNSTPFSKTQFKLEYNSQERKRYIVIGGNRLSRGLTLEGLSVSVFARNAPQYDTLLQMGRWFGYRPGYRDLTRLYVEEQLADSFADLARIELELRNDLAKYAEMRDPPITPLDLMPKIRLHPDMAITARNKLGAGGKVVFDFQGTTRQTVNFPVESKQALQGNLDLGRGWITSLGKPTISAGVDETHFWKDIQAEKVVDFLRKYTFGNKARDVKSKELCSYITRKNDHNELVVWDVIIPAVDSKIEPPLAWNTNVLSRKVVRSRVNPYSIGVLYSKSDIKEWRDVLKREDEPQRGAIFLYVIDKNSEEGNPLCKDYPRITEDILGIVFSFPHSHATLPTEYFGQGEDLI